MQKRSTGITILGALIIISCLALLFLAVNPKPYLELYVKPLGIFLYALAIVFTLFEIILGINILLLKEWARKFIVILNAAYIVFLCLTPLMQNDRFLTYYEQRYRQRLQLVLSEQKIRMEKIPLKGQGGIKKYIAVPLETQFIINDNALKKAVTQAIFIIYIIFLSWYLFMLFFFTRAKVKQQFS